MPVARTAVPLLIQPSIGLPSEQCIEGTVAIAADFAITDSSDSTVAIYLGGLIPWEISNESGASATFTFANAITQNGTALTKYDGDGVAVAALTLGDDCSQELAGLSGCSWLVITGAAAGSHFSLKCMR